MQKTAEVLQTVADLYENHVSHCLVFTLTPL